MGFKNVALLFQAVLLLGLIMITSSMYGMPLREIKSLRCLGMKIELALYECHLTEQHFVLEAGTALFV